MGTADGLYPPGCKVVRYHHPKYGPVEVIIHDREYFDGGREYGAMRYRCERWGRESREWLEKIDDATDIVAAFVPPPNT